MLYITTILKTFSIDPFDGIKDLKKRKLRYIDKKVL